MTTVHERNFPRLRALAQSLAECEGPIDKERAFAQVANDDERHLVGLQPGPLDDQQPELLDVVEPPCRRVGTGPVPTTSQVWEVITDHCCSGPVSGVGSSSAGVPSQAITGQR